MTVPASVTNPTKGHHKIFWDGLGVASSADSGDAVVVPGFSDVTIQVLGTFAGATITIQGSNDGGTTWATINDLFGAAMTFTSAGIKGVAEGAERLRPTITAGSSSNLDVYAVVRRP